MKLFQMIILESQSAQEGSRVSAVSAQPSVWYRGSVGIIGTSRAKAKCSFKSMEKGSERCSFTARKAEILVVAPAPLLAPGAWWSSDPC